ncbi:MAG: hypothetical protein FWH17_10530 [Oscillospiraceae bacterium]|nr:hypothetical protein [Oscillospiraceae bacterium]
MKTAQGNPMPCDTPGVEFRIDAKGTARCLTPDRLITPGYVLAGREPGSVLAYMPHFATCSPYKAKQTQKKAESSQPKINYDQMCIFQT